MKTMQNFLTSYDKKKLTSFSYKLPLQNMYFLGCLDKSYRIQPTFRLKRPIKLPRNKLPEWIFVYFPTTKSYKTYWLGEDPVLDGYFPQGQQKSRSRFLFLTGVDGVKQPIFLSWGTPPKLKADIGVCKGSTRTFKHKSSCWFNPLNHQPLKFEKALFKSNSHNILPKKITGFKGFLKKPISLIFFLLVWVAILFSFKGFKQPKVVQSYKKPPRIFYSFVQLFNKSDWSYSGQSGPFRLVETTVQPFETAFKMFLKASNGLLFASIGKQMVLQQRSNQNPAENAIFKPPIYNLSLFERQNGYKQNLHSVRIKPVVPLQAIVDRPIPKVNIEKPVPIEFITGQYDLVFKSYTYRNLLREFFSNYQKFKPYFDQEENGSYLYKNGKKILASHWLASQELHNSRNPETCFPYQVDQPMYQAYQIELISLDKTMPQPSEERDKRQREIMIKFKPHLKHLKYGLVGIDLQGNTIMDKNEQKEFNEIVNKAAQLLELPAPTLLTHHIDPKYTSNKTKNGESHELGLGMPDSLIRHSEANKVRQFEHLNQIDETLTDFCLKNLPPKDRNDYCYGQEVYAYVIRNKLNPETSSKAKVEPQPGCIYLSTFDENKRGYLEQEQAIKRTSQSHLRMDEVLRETDRKGLLSPMSNEHQAIYKPKKRIFRRVVKKRKFFIRNQKKQYRNEQNQQLKKASCLNQKSRQ